jgi:holo-[acyl-carrier protein] synthase
MHLGVIGIGIDLVEIDRIQRAIDRTGMKFLARVFTPCERRLCGGRAWRLAGRFAAKEALLKAAGTGLRGFSWQDIEILTDSFGAPIVTCHGNFAAVLSGQGVSHIHLSISHSRDFAVAQAVLEGDDG